MLGRRKKDRPEGFKKRLRTVSVVLALSFVLLAGRLWELQVVRWGEFRRKSDSNRLRIQRLESPRGMVYGRRGDNASVVLADNRAARDLIFVPAECTEDPAGVCERLEALVGIDGEALLEKIQRALRAKQPHRQIVIKRDVPRSILARAEEYSFALPGVITVVRPQRRYVYGKTAGQIMGYLGEIGPQELEALRPLYRMGDLVGRSGLERAYEEALHGQDGQMLVTRHAAGVPQLRTDAYGNPYVVVDSFGHSLRVEQKIKEPIAGQPLFIGLDIGLQARAEELLENEHGAIVVLEATTGQVLALASAPGYDPGIFVKRGMGRLRTEVLTTKPNRMQNRCFQETYAPGSTFKILLAAAAIEEEVIDADTTFYCPGKFRITAGGRPWHCWKRSGHGDIAVVDALAFSCDVFFYNVGLKLRVDRIHEWSTRFGFGVKSGIDLPGEVEGLAPSRQWKEALLKPSHPDEPWEYRWYPGDTVNLAIGQGAMAATPLQAAVLMAAFVNDGRRVRPYLNAALTPRVSETLLSESTLALVRKGLRKCVEKGPPAPSGTGNAAAIDGMVVIGKTGSSQMVSLKHQEKYENEEDMPKEIRDHAWFVAGVLDREPPIALCILVEHGHHGSSVAAPLAKELIDYFYANRTQPEAQVARLQENGP